MSEVDKLMTVSELESSLGISRSSLYRLARMGRVPAYGVGPKLSGLRFIKREVLEALRRPVKVGNGDGGTPR